MRRAIPALIAMLYLALPSPSFAKGGPRTLSDYNIQKEYLMSGSAKRGRYFNGMTTRFKSDNRGQRRGFFPGTSRYPTVKLQRTR